MGFRKIFKICDKENNFTTKPEENYKLEGFVHGIAIKSNIKGLAVFICNETGNQCSSKNCPRNKKKGHKALKTTEKERNEMITALKVIIIIFSCLGVSMFMLLVFFACLHYNTKNEIFNADDVLHNFDRFDRMA